MYSRFATRAVLVLSVFLLLSHLICLSALNITSHTGQQQRRFSQKLQNAWTWTVREWNWFYLWRVDGRWTQQILNFLLGFLFVLLFDSLWRLCARERVSDLMKSYLSRRTHAAAHIRSAHICQELVWRRRRKAGQTEEERGRERSVTTQNDAQIASNAGDFGSDANTTPRQLLFHFQRLAARIVSTHIRQSADIINSD